LKGINLTEINLIVALFRRGVRNLTHKFLFYLIFIDAILFPHFEESQN
jgi:hypothetical protein